MRRALAFFAPLDAWKDLSAGTPQALGCLLVPLHIASITFPVVAAVAMLAWLIERVPVAPLGLAGVLAGFAAFWLAQGMVRDRRTPDGRMVNGARQLSLLHIVPSSVATIIALIAVTQDAVEGVPGIAGLVADVIVGVISLNFYRPTRGSRAVTTQLNERRLDRTLAAVEPLRRAAITQDLQTALSVLEAGGLIEPAVARAACQAPFGRLALEFAPRPETRQEGWRRPGS